MKKQIDLLKGPILPSLAALAFPIMLTSLIQMAYNLTDMIWIGRVGSDAVAAVGAAGMYMWLANGLTTIAKMGGQVLVGQALGSQDETTASKYARTSMQFGIFMGVFCGALAILFAKPLIHFFRLNSPSVIRDAEMYLRITSGLVVFSFVNQIFTGVLTAMGNSKTSFFATAIGLVVNMVLDPVLIFGVGPFPKMGVTGAAIATVLAQMIVTVIFILYARKDAVIFRRIHILEKLDLQSLVEIVKIGLPVGVQSMIFTGISMLIARMIASFGDGAVAIQKVGSQIESISWMTAEGFGAAVNAFMAQNLGANNRKRIVKGYQVAIGIEVIWGLICTAVLYFLAGPIFGIFIPEANLLPLGIDYLQILAASQLFMCIEITTAGAFSGLGKTIPPSVSSILFTAARIPMAYVLIRTALGLNGIWWSVTISSILKGVVITTWFLIFLRTFVKEKKCNKIHQL